MEKGSILVVDDEKLIRWSLKETLEQEGYRVRDVETGKGAVGAVEEGGILSPVEAPALPGGEGLPSGRRSGGHLGRRAGDRGDEPRPEEAR